MHSLEREYSEKRNFIRMKVNTSAQVSIATDQHVHEGICQDLSGGGMLVRLEEAPPLDTELTVTVTSNHGHNPMLRARCIVARVEPGPKQSFLVGLEIQDLLDTLELVE
jgi:c-di-GMP-binding flagellar brake protein YcgR